MRPPDMNETDIKIEELRRRAKDNKAKNAEYHLTHSLDNIKNLQLDIQKLRYIFKDMKINFIFNGVTTTLV